MTTTTSRRKAEKKQSAKKARVKKPLRIRPEFLPESAIYVTIDSLEYIALPTSGYTDWFESVENQSVADYTSDPEDRDKSHALHGARKKFLPAAAKKLTIDKVKYHAIPVEDFADWYEDISDIAVCQYVRENPQPTIPYEEAFPKAATRRGGRK